MSPGLFIVDDEPGARHSVASLASSLRIPCQTYASAEELLRTTTRPGRAVCWSTFGFRT